MTITANNTSKTYGQTVTFAGTEFTSSGLQNGETIGTVTLTSAGAPATADVAGSPYAIVASAATGGTFDPTNYTIGYVNGALTVNPAALTITANSTSKAYGQTVTFAGTEFTSTPLQNGETIGTVTLTSAGAPATADVAGSPYAIAASAATGGTFDPTNYNIGYVNGTLTVSPAALTITANSTSKAYGQTITFAGTEFTSAGLQNGETIGTVTLTSAGAPATADVAGSPYAIVASAATGGTFDPTNYTIGYVNGTLTITPATLTVTADSTSKAYGQTVTFAGTEFTSAGLQNGDTIGTVTLTSAGAAATANVAGSPYAIVASAATGTFNPANYSLNYVNGTLTVNPAALTITADSTSKTYGQTVTFAGTEFMSTGLQNGETIGTVTLTSAGAPATADVAGSPYAIVASAATGTFNPANYTFNYVNGALTVNQAALTITADSTSKTYGQTVTFAGTEFTSAGLQNGETIGTVTLTSAGAPATADVAGSPYAIAVSAATGGTFNPANYSFNYVNGTLAVNPAMLTVSLTATVVKVYDGTTAATLTGSNYLLTGILNGDNVGLSAGTANYGTPNSGTNELVTVGGLSLTGASAGNYQLTNGGPLSANIGTINPATLTYLANPVPNVYGATLPALSGTVTGFVNGESQASATTGALNFTTAAMATSNVGSYAIDGSGLTANNGNYVFVQAAANATALTITPASLTISTMPVTKTYDGTDNALGTVIVTGGTLYTNANTGVPDSVSGGTFAFTDPNAGTGKTVNVSGVTVSDGNGGNNYLVTYLPNTTSTINPATLTYLANPAPSVYGATLPSFSGNVTGFVNGESQASATTGALNFTTAAMATSNVGSYAIDGSGLTANNGNYVFVQAPANATALTITPASLTISTMPVTKTYDGTDTALGTVIVTGGTLYTNANTGVPDSVSGGAFAFTDPNAGTGKTVNVSGVTVSDGNGGNNYLVTYLPNTTSTINPATLTISTMPVTKTYDGTDTALGTAVLTGGTLYTNANTGVPDSVSGGTFAFTDPNAGTGKTVNVSGVTVSDGNGGNNYSVTYVANSTSTITPAALTITANSTSKTYGQTITFAGTEFTSAGLQNGETIGTVTLTSAGAPATADVAGSPYAIVASAATGTFNPANYSIGYVNGTLTINPATLTITADSTSKAYGQTVTFAGTEFTSAGLQNGETIGTVTLTSAGAAATANVAGSPYAIVASAATGTFNPANYSLNYVNGTLTVGQAALTFTANPATSVYGATLPALSGTVTGFVNGDTQATATTGALTFTTVASPTSNVGSYAITGGGLVANNYSFIQAPANATALTITPAPLTITANPVTKTYDGTDNALGTPLVTGGTLYVNANTGVQDSVSGGTYAFTDPNVGTGKTVNVSGVTISDGNGGNNYTVTYVPNTSSTITVAPLTITADSFTIAPNAPLPNFTATFTGLAATDTLADFSGTLMFQTTATVGSPIGTYPIVPSGVSDPNYQITFADGTLSIATGIPNISIMTGGADGAGSNIVPPAANPPAPQPIPPPANYVATQGGSTPPPVNYTGNGMSSQTGQQDGGLANSSSNSTQVTTDDAAEMNNGQVNNVSNPQASSAINQALGPAVFNNLSNALGGANWADAKASGARGKEVAGGAGQETILGAGEVAEIGGASVKKISMSKAPKPLQVALDNDAPKLTGPGQ